MDQIVLISLPISELETFMMRCVNTCLKYHKPEYEQQQESDEFILRSEAKLFVNLKDQAFDQKARNGEFPVYKKGKLTYFSKKDLNDWIRSGRKKTALEISAEADNYLLRKGKRIKAA